MDEHIYVQGKNVRGSKEKNIKPKITRSVIEVENWRTWCKNLFATLQAKMIH